jgi:nucleotide-binding universal stress UspA family protein
LIEDVVLPENSPVRLKFYLRSGRPDLEIGRFVRERDFDLIVMGTHGRGALGHALMGSVAEKVVRTAPCPVLTLRGPQRESAAPNILVALDFEPLSDTALTYGRGLARAFGAQLHVLHVQENYFLRPMACDPHTLAGRTRKQLADRLTDEDRSALRASATIEVSDTPADAIVAHAKQLRIDLLIVGTHGRQAADRLLMGSVAERIVRTAPCPVLTVRHPEREFVLPDPEEIAASTRV